MSGSAFHNVNLANVRITGASIDDMTMDGVSLRALLEVDKAAQDCAHAGLTA
ncbi:MAG: hypothetical protein ACFB3T_06915 [Geminicoccaceae bacterium]